MKCGTLRYIDLVTGLGKARNVYKTFVAKTHWKEWLLGRPKRRLEENIKDGHQGICCNDGRGLEVSES